MFCGAGSKRKKHLKKMSAAETKLETKLLQSGEEKFCSGLPSIVAILGGRRVGASSLVIKKFIPEYKQLHDDKEYDNRIMLFSDSIADQKFYKEEGKLLETYENLNSDIVNTITKYQKSVALTGKKLLIIFEKSRSYNQVYATVEFQALLRNHIDLNISMIFVLDLEDLGERKKCEFSSALHGNYQTTWRAMHDVAFVYAQIIYFFYMPAEIATEVQKMLKRVELTLSTKSFIALVYKR